jgi:hypothetical protein
MDGKNSRNIESMVERTVAEKRERREERESKRKKEKKE